MVTYTNTFAAGRVESKQTSDRLASTANLAQLNEPVSILLIHPTQPLFRWQNFLWLKVEINTIRMQNHLDCSSWTNNVRMTSQVFNLTPSCDRLTFKIDATKQYRAATKEPLILPNSCYPQCVFPVFKPPYNRLQTYLPLLPLKLTEITTHNIVITSVTVEKECTLWMSSTCSTKRLF